DAIKLAGCIPGFEKGVRWRRGGLDAQGIRDPRAGAQLGRAVQPVVAIQAIAEGETDLAGIERQPYWNVSYERQVLSVDVESLGGRADAPDVDRLQKNIAHWAFVSHRHAVDGLDNVGAAGHLTEDGVAIVEIRAASDRDEELRAVRIGPRVGHRQDPGVRKPKRVGDFIRHGITRPVSSEPVR